MAGRSKRRTSRDTKTAEPAKQAARFDYHQLDRTLHERARLGILTCLCSQGNDLTFPVLARLCALTAGNLSRHLQILKRDGVVTVVEVIWHHQPLTCYRLTPEGRERFMRYLAVLNQVTKDGAAALHAARHARLPPQRTQD